MSCWCQGRESRSLATLSSEQSEIALATCTEASLQGLVVFAAQIATQAPLRHSLSWRAIGRTVSYANRLRSLVLPELLGSCPSSVGWDPSHTAVHGGAAEPSNRKLQKSVASGHDCEPGSTVSRRSNRPHWNGMRRQGLTSTHPSLAAHQQSPPPPPFHVGGMVGDHLSFRWEYPVGGSVCRLTATGVNSVFRHVGVSKVVLILSKHVLELFKQWAQLLHLLSRQLFVDCHLSTQPLVVYRRSVAVLLHQGQVWASLFVILAIPSSADDKCPRLRLCADVNEFSRTRFRLREYPPNWQMHNFVWWVSSNGNYTTLEVDYRPYSYQNRHKH